MHLGEAGEGFVGSMMALMVVTASLTVFMAVLPSAFGPDEGRDVPLDFLDGVRMEDGELMMQRDIDSARADIGAEALRVDVRIIGGGTYTLRSGSSDSERIWRTSGSLTVAADDGRRLNAVYEVAAWY